MSEMSYSSNFYYSSKRLKTTFSYNPVGYPDINKLIKGEPYWRLTQFLDEPKKKTLLIADWASTTWSPSKTAEVTSKISELLENEFEIYILQENNFVPLTKYNLSLLNKVKTHRITPGQVLDRAIEQKIGQEQTVYILDDYQIDCLLDSKTLDKPRQLSSKQLATLNGHFQEAIPLLFEATPPIGHFEHNEYSQAGVQAFLEFQKKFPDVTRSTHYTSVQFIKEQASELVEDGYLDSYGLVFKKSQLKNIETLKFNNSTITSDELNEILRNTKSLKSLVLFACRNLVNGSPKIQSFSELQELVLHRCSITTENLAALVSNTPKLQSLILNCTGLNDTPEINVDFSNLEKISCSGTNLNCFSLDELFSSKQLKSISFSACKLPTGNIKHSEFNSLIELTISRNNLSSNNILKILAGAPNLQVMRLDNHTKFSEQLLAQLPTYYFLKELHLSDSEISEQEFATLIEKAPNLKSLKLDFCKNIISDLPKLRYESLESLEIGGDNFSLHNLQTLITGTSKLKDIFFFRVNTDWEILAASFSTIEFVNLQECNITCDGLKKLINAAPNLRNIDFTDCPDLIIDDELNELLKERQLAQYAPRPQKNNEFKSSTSIASYDSESTKNAPEKLNSTTPVDADTSFDKPKEYHVQRIFFPIDENVEPPNVMHDRFSVFNKVNVKEASCDLKHAFTLSKVGDAALVPVILKACTDDVFTLGKTFKKTEGTNLYYGKQELALNHEWQALASLAPNERLTHYHVDPPVAGIEIKYSLRDNQYYIRSKTAQSITIDFLLEVPHRKMELPQEIKEIIKKYNHFGDGELEVGTDEPNGYDYLRYIQEQEKGACRHRTIAFKDWMETYFPEMPVRIVNNGCHSFVEVQYNDEWILCDLGGYPAELILEGENRPQIIPEKPFAKSLETWNKTQENFISAGHYCQHLIQKDNLKKRLIELPNNQDVNSLQLILQSYCHHISRPVYYIDSPNDLICSSAFIKRKDNQGFLHQGPGGDLYDFLQKHRNQSDAPVLLVNYANFNADDIVRFNGLLDDMRHADGTPLPESAQIIGLINPNKPQAYQGEDFYSRFDKIDVCPINSTSLKEAEPVLAIPEKSQSQSTSFPINLFHSADWEERLLGRWVLHKDTFSFEEGELVSAFASGLPIELQNAPWHDPRFINFWLSMQIHRKIESNGRTLDVPANLQLLKSEGYDWNRLAKLIDFKMGCKSNAVVLNSTSLSDFFNQYDCDNQSNTLDQIPGILENHSQKVLDVNLTSLLEEDEWAMLLTACEKYRVKLVCHTPLGVNLTTPFAEKLPINRIPSKIWQGEMTSTLIISSSDPDTTVSKLIKEDKDWQVIDVSECSSADLLVAMQGKLNPKLMKFEFNRSEKALLTALASEQKVILKGSFSKELSDSLASLLLKRQTDNDAKGQLILVSDNTDSFSYVSPVKHEVTPDEKYECLLKLFAKQDLDCLTQERLRKESLSQLKARVYFNQKNPESSTDDAWKGMYSLPIAIRFTDFDVVHSKKKSEEFIAQRLQAVHQVFEYSPYVFLTGLTAVGKSTFVEKYLQDSSNTLYQGESKMKAWAQDNSPGRKILFIDEANVENRQWSEFEGLFNNAPGILIDGVYYPLTKDHKVVFAGNPLNYGGERQLAPLFTRHGNAVLFQPMPQEFIYEEIIRPIFANTKLEKETLTIATPLLNVYRFLCEHSHEEVLISPREIQMMALQVLCAYEKGITTEVDILASHYAYQLGKTLVPFNLEKEFDNKFKLGTELKLPPIKTIGAKDYHVTSSRYAIHTQLEELLELRSLRQATINPVQKYGGINGMILEGEPGIGKSEMVISTLVANGYKEAFLNSNLEENQSESITSAGKIFYRMPVSMQYEDKKRLLLKAFHEGAIVIVDEINSSPMMERLLNDLLMGKTPEGKRPSFPGFLLIGTQNPATMAGRLSMGNALARRVIRLVLPPYKPEEMQEILAQKGLQPDVVSDMVDAFDHCSRKAKKNHLTPAPTFRDLLRVAKNYLKSLLKPSIDRSVAHAAESKTVREVPLTGVQTKFMRYEKVCESFDTNIDKAVALLKDYIGSSSVLYGTWKRRPYHKEIARVIKQVGIDKEIKTVTELLLELKKIEVAENAPLKHRIQFMQEYLESSLQQKTRTPLVESDVEPIVIKTIN
ncbi:AAA family ATPase [Legionella hackeliae]|uniref:Uncharacterized protein n=1 Tax=Legionella hackeliae TaxID=449 RepID=A0A0A8UPQ3_LEGHA|nr:AAA family ATPase [Legionella hackeliae]KTD09817.1 AAA domain (dynein-related subfamily) [Legionella hackeliae]CEK10855.1 conserved protein of unknown function [F-BOX/LEUCINE RICH REPEAT PROTEIN] [Legionella hackeliae]STX47591.1 AAA domain (dynein-related subfamily) [Legionella hackeliae]